MKITFLVAAWHEEKTIGECLKHILSLNYQKRKLEIIVACDKNTAKIAKKYPVKIILEKERLGKPKAVLNMLKHASGDIIIVNDAENFIFPSDALHKVVKYFQNPKIGGVSFSSISHPYEIKMGHWVLIEEIIYELFNFYKIRNYPVKSLKKANFPIITNAFRNVIKKLETINDDGEISYRLLKKGYYIGYAFDVMWYSKGSTPSNLSDSMKQKVRTNVGWDQIRSKYNLSFKNFYLRLFGLTVACIINFIIYWGISIYSMIKAKILILIGRTSAKKIWKKIKRY